MTNTIENTKPATSEKPATEKQPKVAAKQPKRILETVQPKVAVVADKQQVQKYTKLLDDNNMRSVFTVRENEDATEEHICDLTFNYAECNREELLELATASTRITIQSRIRKMSPEARKVYCSQSRVVNVKTEIVAAARQQRDPLATMIGAFARARGITEAQARPLVVGLMETKL